MKSFNNNFENYLPEVREKWGNTAAFKEHKEKTKTYGADKWSAVNSGLDDILAEFSVCLKNGETPDSKNPQNLVKKLQNFITENYYTCTDEILAGLGQMYVADERFKTNIDKHAEGNAEFISKAIKIYTKGE